MSDPTPREAALTYRFGTGAPTGIWLGLGATRIAVLAAGLLATVALLGMRTGVLTGAGPLLAAAVVTLVPVGGRPLLGWMAPAAGHGKASLAGTSRWTAPVPDAPVPYGPVTGQAGCWPSEGRRLRLPPECGRLRLAEVVDPDGGWPVAVLREARSPAATLVLRVAGPDRFAVADPDGQDRAVAGWGRVLCWLAQQDRESGQVQLVERVSAADPDVAAFREWAAGRGEPAAAALAGLVDVVETVTVRRDSLLAVRLAGLRDGRDPAARAREVAGQLLAADLVARPLAAAELAGFIGRVLNPGQGGAADADTGPVSRRSGWETVRTDDCWHRSYAVTGWPGSPLPANWLSTLLLAAPPAGAWTTAVHLGTVAPQVAGRLARAARTKAELDRADRARLGMPASAAADQAVADSAGMDAELVAGHATHRLAAVLTCSAGCPGELEDSARTLLAAAANAGLTVRPLHGQHHLALAATLPTCRLRFGGVT